MSKIIKSKDKSIEVHLLDKGLVEIESQRFRNVAVEVRLVDPTIDVSVPKGAIYEISLYKPEEKVKSIPFEYDIVWVMPNGEIIHRKDRRYLGV